MKPKTALYLVDVQNDFMNEEGRLYVPKAESIKPALAKLSQQAKENGIRRIFSRDRHFTDDPELTENNGPFPQHCMDWSYGQMDAAGAYGIDFIPELRVGQAHVIENKTGEGFSFREYSFSELEEIARSDVDLVVEKQRYQASTNPYFSTLLKQSGITDMVVAGVATDYCNKAAVVAMQGIGMQTYLVTDAIAGIGEEASRAALQEMTDAGAKLITEQQAYEVLKCE